MNNRIRTVVISIFALLLLAGCAGKSTYVDKEYMLQTVDTTQQKQIELNDFKIQNSAMISLKDVIKLNNMNIEKVSFYDADNLLILCTNTEYTRMDAYVFSLDYGTLQWMGAIEDISEYQGLETEYSIVRMNPLIIQENNSLRLWVLEDKSVQVKIDLDVKNNRQCVVCDKYIYYPDSKENTIKRIDFYTGEEEVFFEEIETYSYSIRELESVSKDGRYLYTTGINKITLQNITCVINTVTGKMVADVNGKFRCWESDYAIYAGHYENNIYSIHQRTDDNYYNVKVANLLPNVAFEYCIVKDDTVITVETDGKMYNFAYVDLENMTTEYVAGIDMNSYYMSAFSEECNYSYCMMDEEYSYNPKRELVVYEVASDLGRKNVFLWDIKCGENVQTPVSTDSYSETLNDHVIQTEDYGEISETIQSVYEEYGVAIYIGENVPHTFTDYRSTVAGNVETIQNAVKLIKKVLGYYPHNFFKDFTTNDYVNGINIYLVGDMTPLSDKYIDNPAGFSTNMQDYEVIALNINDTTYIESNLCHELAHAIYKRIKYQEFYSNTVYFDMEEWAKLNPAKFEYYNSYQSDYEKDSQYTGEVFEEDSDLKNIYFVDSYSKTMLEEDLARLMEYGMIKDDEPYLASPKIKNKMKYFYQVIRKVWNTKGWPEETIWERTSK